MSADNSVQPPDELRALWLRAVRQAVKDARLWMAEQNETIEAVWKYNRMVDVHLALDRPRPANKSLADWRMALRRKLNGDTR